MLASKAFKLFWLFSRKTLRRSAFSRGRATFTAMFPIIFSPTPVAALFSSAGTGSANVFRTSEYGNLSGAIAAAAASAYADDYVVLVDTNLDLGAEGDVFPFPSDSLGSQQAEFQLDPAAVTSGSPVFMVASGAPVRELKLNLPSVYSDVYLSGGASVSEIHVTGSGETPQLLGGLYLTDPSTVPLLVSKLYLTNLDVGTVDIRGADGGPGADGAGGNSADGEPGSAGANGDAATPAGDGGSGDSGGNGGSGEDGEAGLPGGDSIEYLYLDGCTLGDLLVRNGLGGNGGNGGDGGSANGGSGGNGGSAGWGNYTYPNGGNGGSGGAGGIGGSGGNGGAAGSPGTLATYLVGTGAPSTVVSYDSGAYWGSPGSGGLGGDASAGIGAGGGDTWYDENGAVGSPGAAGSSGSTGTSGSPGNSGTPGDVSVSRTLVDPDGKITFS